MANRRYLVRDNYTVQCNHSRGKIEFNFNTGKCIIIILLVTVIGGTFFYHKRKIAKLQEQVNQKMVVDNGDGTSSTSISKVIEDKSITMKEDLTNQGKQIMLTHKLKQEEVSNLNLIYKETLDWGGTVEVVNNADISFEYLVNPDKFNISLLPSNAYHVEIPKEAFEVRALLDGKELVKTKLSFKGKVEQTLDFKKKDFVLEAQNNAEKFIRKSSQEAAERTLKETETLEKLVKTASTYYTKYLKKFGERVYITTI